MAKKIKTQNMTEKQATILAGIFARSNMGQGEPSKQTLERMVTRPTLTLNGVVMACCGDIMENDEHYTMFYEEACDWYRGFKKQSLEQALSPHRDMAYLLPLLAKA